MQRVDVDWIYDVSDERLDHTAIAAVHGRVLDLFGQLDGVHGGHGPVRVDGQLLVARVCRLDAFQACVLGRAVMKEPHHVGCFGCAREVNQRLCGCGCKTNV